MRIVPPDDLNHDIDDRNAVDKGLFTRFAINTILRMTLAPLFIREVIQRHRVTIILYHRISHDTAKKHLDALVAKYNVISLKDYIDARETNSTARLPKKSLVITLDDGHRSNSSLMKLVRAYDVKPTIFLCSGVVGTNRHFWFLEIDAEMRERLKVISQEERLKELGRIDYTDQKEFADRQALSLSELNELKGVFDLQSHTVTHPCLTKCTDQKAWEEISASKSDLEKMLNSPITAISYPNGDYSEREVKMARDAGYRCGITVDLGFNDNQTNLFKLRRICMRDEGGTTEALVRATGLYDALKNFFKRASPQKSEYGNNGGIR